MSGTINLFSNFLQELVDFGEIDRVEAVKEIHEFLHAAYGDIL